MILVLFFFDDMNCYLKKIFEMSEKVVFDKDSYDEAVKKYEQYQKMQEDMKGGNFGTCQYKTSPKKEEFYIPQSQLAWNPKK